MNSEGIESNSSSVNTASNRLKKELMDLMMSFEKGISAFPQEDSIFRWIATIDGPKDSVYENLKFKLSLKFPQNYPYTPPTIRFMTCCFHPNIDSDGVICLDILKDKWTASYDIRSILLSIQSLLNEPNLDSPLDLSAAALWGRPNFKQVMLKNYNSSDSSKSSKN